MGEARFEIGQSEPLCIVPDSTVLQSFADPRAVSTAMPARHAIISPKRMLTNILLALSIFPPARHGYTIPVVGLLSLLVCDRPALRHRVSRYLFIYLSDPTNKLPHYVNTSKERKGKNFNMLRFLARNQLRKTGRYVRYLADIMLAG